MFGGGSGTWAQKEFPALGLAKEVRFRPDPQGPGVPAAGSRGNFCETWMLGTLDMLGLFRPSVAGGPPAPSSFFQNCFG